MAPAVICMCDRCSAVYRLLRSSLRIRWSDITRKQKIEGKSSCMLHTEDRRAPLSVLLIDRRNPENPLQVCYCSGSGTCNRSEMHYSFFLFSLTLHYLCVCSCNSSVCSELLTRSLPRPWLRPLFVHRLQQRHFLLLQNSLAKIQTWLAWSDLVLTE